jgi:hypothetical protein
VKKAFTAYFPRPLLAAVAACAFGLLLSLAVPAGAAFPGDAIPGSAADPLVTRAWVEDYVQESFAPLYQRLDQLEQRLGGVNIVLTIGSNQALISGKTVTVPAPPQIMGAGYTMVPARFIGEALGLKVDWNDASRKVTFSGPRQDIALIIGNTAADINGQAYAMPMPPVIAGGYTLVHVRFVSEAFGCKVDWNQNTRQVIITK